MNAFGDIKINNEVKKVKLNLKSPFETFKGIYHNSNSSYLLESMESDSGLSRYSMIGFRPSSIIRARNNLVEIENRDETQKIEVENPFDIIKSLINHQKGKKGFRGGLVGYVSYEAARHFEPVSLNIGEEPDFEFGLFLDGIIFDRINNRCEYLTMGEDRSHQLQSFLKENFETGKLQFKEEGKYFSSQKFEAMVSEAQERIKAGEIFQSVLSNATEYTLNGDRLSFYEKLRKINPSPYMYHLKLGEREIIGSSPEMLVRVENKMVETFPIAGTRPRGNDHLEDEILQQELLCDEKERAEHLMLVDLARNDVGKVSEFGTVTVPEYFTVKKFSHVQHIVSRVQGKLKNNKTAVDAFSSIFPAGTVSGAPKIRAMEIINELESKPRGPYAGAVGYFALNGNADFAITIRTLIANGKHAKIQAGAGIVHDSIPEKEYEECQNKAKALISAME
ncbi:MAG TPA: anthranilate synthase component I [Methanobacteriaceae archaeon]|nr:anthranilate synthase component I [Methanobacteriaceae archaeon]